MTRSALLKGRGVCVFALLDDKNVWADEGKKKLVYATVSCPVTVSITLGRQDSSAQLNAVNGNSERITRMVASLTVHDHNLSSH